MKKKPSLLFICLCFLLGATIWTVFAPWLTPFSEDAGHAMHFEQKLQSPSWQHPFGTDGLGRDMFTLVIFGARLSLLAAFCVVGLAMVLGIPLGLAAGYFGGLIEEGIMRLCDAFLAFPPLLLPVLFTAALGPSLTNAIIGVAISWFPWYVRILRAQVLVVKQAPYITAAQAIGLSRVRLLWRHVLPNSLAPLLVQATLDLGYAILTVAGLSFIGFGARPPAIEWGLMITAARSSFLDYWWTAFFPGVALFSTVLAFNLTGDGLRKKLGLGDRI